MSVAIIDYGSGNLHSAQKAFERAAREAGLSREMKVTARPEDVLAADHVVYREWARLPTAAGGSTALRGMVEAMEEAVRRRGRPFLGICFWANSWRRAASNMRRSSGLDWIAGDVAAIKPRDPELKIPPMGWNTLDVREAMRSWRASARARPGCTPISCIPINCTLDEPDDLVGDRGLWRPCYGDRRPRQHCGYAVSPRKEPNARAQR